MKTTSILIAALLASACSLASAKCTVTLKRTKGEGSCITVLGNDSQSRVYGGL
jgi:hypothetical protein